MRTYHVYRNGRPALPTVNTAGTPVWGGQPLLPPTTTSLDSPDGSLILDLRTAAGREETEGEE